MFTETQQTFGKLDILVNNAGIYEFAPLEAITEERSMIFAALATGRQHYYRFIHALSRNSCGT